MSVADGDVVITQDRSSGVVHKRVRVGNHLASLEADNLDAAGEYLILPRGIPDATPGYRLCTRCYPGPQDEAPLDVT